MQYNKPFDQTNPAAGYVNGNPATNTAGSIPCAEGLEYPQREIVAAITAAGLTPTNNDLTQLAQAIRALAGSQGLTILDNRSIVGSKLLVFDTVGTTNWPVPAGITKGLSILWGGAGGGSGWNNAAGAAGGFSLKLCTFSNGQIVPVTVGPGGLGTTGSSNGSGNYGGDGGLTSFGSFHSATGGKGGGAGSTAGGIGIGGDLNLQGSSGQDLDSTNTYALGGSANFGGGATTGPGLFPGGGGGASGTANGANPSIGNAGQNGAQGAVFLFYAGQS